MSDYTNSELASALKSCIRRLDTHAERIATNAQELTRLKSQVADLYSTVQRQKNEILLLQEQLAMRKR